MDARIVCQAIVVDVPDAVAGGHELAAVQRAMVFAQYAAGIGSPVLVDVRRVAPDVGTDGTIGGAYRVRIREASAATAAARDG